MILKINNIKSFFYLILYKFFLDLAYVVYVHDKFEYMGFVLDFSLNKYLIGFAVFIILFTLLPKKRDLPSTVVMQLHYIVMIIPMFTIYAFMNKSTKFMLTCSLVFALQSILFRFLPNFKILSIRNSKYVLGVLVVVMSFTVYFLMLRSNGIPSLSSLNLLNVYDLRVNVVYPLFSSYLVNWQAKVINPFLISVAYTNRKKKFFMISICLQIFLFMITGHKSFILIPVAIVMIIRWIEKFDFLKVSSFISALSTFGLIIWHWLTQDIILPSFLLRRLLFIPAYIRFLYYDFFSENQFLYFSAGSLGEIFSLNYPYDLPPAFLIGDIYFNDPNAGANSGYLGDAYANLGIPGMFLFGIVLVLVIKLIDSLSLKIGKSLTIGLSLFLMLSLNDSALLTALLTGGLLFLLLVLYLYAGSKKEEN